MERRAPRPVYCATLFDDHGHDSVLVRFPPFLVYPHHFVYPDVAHKVAHNENKVAGDNAVRIDVPHRVPRRKGFLRGNDGYDLDS